MTKDYGMMPEADGLTAADLNDPNRGRMDRARMGQASRVYSEPYPIVTPEDRADTLRLIALDRQLGVREAV